MSNPFTPPAPISYPKIFKPDMLDDKKTGEKIPEWSCSLLFDQNDPWLHEVAYPSYYALVAEKFPTAAKTGQVIRSPFRLGIPGSGQTNGGFNLVQNPEYTDKVIIRFASKRRPIQVVDEYAQPLLDQTKIYPGAIVRCSYQLFSYEAPIDPASGRVSGIPGISFGLCGVMFVEDGTPFVPQNNAQEDFAAVAKNPADNSQMFRGKGIPLNNI